MIKSILRATRIEFSFMKERKWSMLFFFIVPSLIMVLFAKIFLQPIDWGQYQSLNLTFYDLYGAGILTLVMVFVTVQFVILRIVGERAPYGTLDRDLLAIPEVPMYIGKLITNFVFVFLQCLLLFFVVTRLFPLRNYGDPSIIFLILMLVSLFGLALGLAISIFSKSKEQATQFVPFIVLLLFISGGFMTGINYPSTIQPIIDNSPLMLANMSLKMTMLDGVSFGEILTKIYVLLFWNIGLILVGLIGFKMRGKK